MKGHLYQSIKAPTKEDFDWLRCEMTGFMRTQILAVAASLRLAEHLQDGGRTADDLAAASGIERSMAFRFLRACTKVGLTDCDDGSYVQVHLTSAGSATRADTRLDA